MLFLVVAAPIFAGFGGCESATGVALTFLTSVDYAVVMAQAQAIFSAFARAEEAARRRLICPSSGRVGASLLAKAQRPALCE
jgi:hypothetical protein